MSLYKQLIDAGVKRSDIDHHESDLYVKKTPLSKSVIDSYQYNYQYKGNVTTFISQIDGKIWYDIPFAYAPFWESKTGGPMETNPKVWGIDESKLLNLSDEFGLDLQNFRRIGRAFAFRIGVKPGTPRRRSAGFGRKHGRLVQSPTFPRMALFILAMFDKGASRIQSAMGNWRSSDEFLYDLHNIREKNIGSIMYPAYLGDRELNEADPKMEEAFEKIWGGY